MSVVGQNIKKLREALEESQSVFGARFGLSRGKIASYEAVRNDSQPTFETVLCIVDNFDIDLRSFIIDPDFIIKADDIANGKLIRRPQSQPASSESASEPPQAQLTPVVTDSGKRGLKPDIQELRRLGKQLNALMDVVGELTLKIAEMHSDVSQNEEVA